MSTSLRGTPTGTISTLAVPEYAPDRLIVKLNADSVKNFATDANITSTQDVNSTGAKILHLAPNVDIDTVMAQYKASGSFQYVEPDYIIKLDAVTNIPNDPSLASEWALNNTGQLDSDGFDGVPDADIDAPEAWATQTGNPNFVIGVIDTGVDITHPDLVNNIYTNPGEVAGNAVDDDHNGYIDDVHGWNFVANNNTPIDGNGHGTHVSGTIAAVGNNGIGVTGVAWNAKIMPLKFLNDAGSGYTSDAVLAINYATMMNVKITNNSWGGGGFSQALLDAISAANVKGDLFIAAAGNSGLNTDIAVNTAYPADYNSPNIISVAASDNWDWMAGFSNYGATTVDLAAPGLKIYSTFPVTFPAGNTHVTNYGSISGTSMASPQVAGAAAVLWSQFPSLTTQQVKDFLMTTVDHPDYSNSDPWGGGAVPDLYNLAGKTVSGGRLNLNNALVAADAITNPPLPSQPLDGFPTEVLPGGTEDILYTIHSADLLSGFSGDPALLGFVNLVATRGDVAPAQAPAPATDWVFTPDLDYNGTVFLNYDVTDGVTTIPAEQNFNLAPVDDTVDFIVPESINFQDTRFDDTFATVAGRFLPVDSSLTLTYGIKGGSAVDAATGFSSFVGTYGKLLVKPTTGDFNFIPNDSAIELLGGALNSVVTDSLMKVTAFNGSVTLEKPFTINIKQVESPTESAGSDSITGTTGDDKIDGKTGADTMTGLAGNDVYNVENIGDKVVENLDEGNDTVVSSITHTLLPNVENLTLLNGIAATPALINGTGNELNNILIGNDAVNVLDGLIGADTLTGGQGSDSYFVDSKDDVIRELPNTAAIPATPTTPAIPAYNGGIDLVSSSVTYKLTTDVENLVLTGTGKINGTGNALVNEITGNGSNNVIDGDLGADKMTGGFGNDIYVVDNIGDTVTEITTTVLGGSGTDLIRSSVTYTLPINVENITLIGASTLAIDAKGNDSNNILKGSLGTNKLTGGKGDDSYFVQNTTDTIVEVGTATTQEGIDSVNSTVTYTLPANVENLSLVGVGVINAVGNALANTLYGNAQANVLSGGLGKDILTAGAGADTFVFALADEASLRTGAGTVVSPFVFARDIIKDFNAGATGTTDKIDLSGIDANTLTPILTTNDAFTTFASGVWAGSFPTTGTPAVSTPASLFFDTSKGMLYGNTNTDSAAEFSIEVKIVGGALVVGDFIL